MGVIGSSPHGVDVLEPQTSTAVFPKYLSVVITIIDYGWVGGSTGNHVIVGYYIYVMITIYHVYPWVDGRA